MRFRITTHSGHSAPPEALDRLIGELGDRRGQGRFRKVGPEIRVTWGRGEGAGWDRPERTELEREELLTLLARTCRASDGLDLGWFAVGPME